MPGLLVGGDVPMVVEPLNDVYARPGDHSAKFQCRIVGQPAPEITW